ncbi:hypothetical protein D3C81_1787570 [compost metagenome]
MERLHKLDSETYPVTVIPSFSHNFFRIDHRCKFTDRHDLLPRTNSGSFGLCTAVRSDVQIHRFNIYRFAALCFIKQMRRN